MRKESPVMDENRVAGSIEEIKGATKVATGQATGDAELQSDGQANKAVGKIQNAAGGLNDAVRDTEAMRSAGLLRSGKSPRSRGVPRSIAAVSAAG
jgi:uncharacterized protein YjbJ (UPF0337 family)